MKARRNQRGKTDRYSLLRASEELHISRETLRKRFRAAGIPVGGHRLYSREEIERAMGGTPKEGDVGDIGEKIKFETWRKLRLRNDREAGQLIDVGEVGTFIFKVLSETRSIMDQKFRNEAPALLEGLEAAQIRFRITKIYDETCTQLALLGNKYPPPKPEADTT